MTSGILWEDNDPTTTLAEKIIKAAEYFQHTYNKLPTLCLVDPRAGTADIEGITLRYKALAPDTIWIGYEEMPTTSQEG